MTHNNVSQFGRNPFARNTGLGWLSLTHNALKRIKTTMFRSMRHMRRLFLSDNQIEVVSYCLELI